MDLALVVFFGAGSVASADGIIVESYTATRPPDVARLTGPVIGALNKHGFVAGVEAVGAVYEGRYSRPPRSADGLPTDFSALVDRYHRSWVTNAPRDAVAGLEPLVEVAKANASMLTQNQPLRDSYQKALTTLAIAQRALGRKDDAVETVGELLRTFPQATVSRGLYGSDVYDFVEGIRKQLGANRGQIEVHAASDATVVFIDEQFSGTGSVTKGDLLPGTYRVMTQVGQQLSRVHRVIVRPGADTIITIDPVFDRALQTGPASTGFVFASASERETLESTYAAQVAGDLGVTQVAVVGIDVVRGQLSVVGSLVDVKSGRDVRQARVPLAPEPTIELLAALGDFLGGLAPDPRLDVLVGATIDHSPRISASDVAHPTQPRWGARLVGVGAVITLGGVIAYTASPGDDGSTPTYRDYRTPSVIVAIAGGAIIGGGGYLWLTNRWSVKPFSASFISGGTAALIAGTILVATSEAEHGGFQRPRIRDTEVAGLIVGGVGLACAGTGLSLWRQQRHSSIAPTITPARGAVTIGLAGEL